MIKMPRGAPPDRANQKSEFGVRPAFLRHQFAGDLPEDVGHGLGGARCRPVGGVREDAPQAEALDGAGGQPARLDVFEDGGGEMHGHADAVLDQALGDFDGLDLHDRIQVHAGLGRPSFEFRPHAGPSRPVMISGTSARAWSGTGAVWPFAPAPAR